MEKERFLEELNKYEIVRDKTYQGQLSTSIKEQVQNISSKVGLDSNKNGSNGIKNGKEDEKYKQVISQLQFFKLLHSATDDQLTKEFIQQYTIMLRNLDLDSCEQLLQAIDK